VLNWIISRCNNPEKTNALETPIGFVPTLDAINTNGLNISHETLQELLKIDPTQWREEIKNREEFFKQFNDRLPKEIIEEQEKLKVKFH
ncbi:phosphoenolpyruvate carboxykinase (GTP), partial [Candidatus Peregrinibacteria bacterium]|nr:phosphoenolpyruvate carboxykinase (GTP) [Candidatus Peregrinibacteria bacterium]